MSTLSVGSNMVHAVIIAAISIKAIPIFNLGFLYSLISFILLFTETSPNASEQNTGFSLCMLHSSNAVAYSLISSDVLLLMTASSQAASTSPINQRDGSLIDFNRRTVPVIEERKENGL